MWTWIVISWVLCVVCFILGMLTHRASADLGGMLECQESKKLEDENKQLLLESAKLQKQLNEKNAECKRIEQAAQRLQHQEKEMLDLVNLYRARACDMSELFKSDLQASHAQQG